jgi:cytochrome c
MGRLAALVAAAAMTLAAQQPGASAGEALIKESDCASCHAVDREVVGPAYTEVAKRYAGQTDAVEKLTAKIRDGGSGMTAHPDLTEAQRTEMVNWILEQKEQKDSAAADGNAETKLYAHTLKDGSTANLDFPVFGEGKAPKVTTDVFHGYQLFNSYCYRCHGTDATGGQLGPDLRRSLSSGMKQQDFLAVAMTGKAEKGMPAWAGFLGEDDVVHIFKYVMGRSLDLVPSGRPPSERD